MNNKVGILAYRANTASEKKAAEGLSAFGRWYLLDELAPGWRSLPNEYLLWSTEEDDSMVVPSAVKFIRNHKVGVIVALGKDTAKALGVPKGFAWFAGYRVTVGKYPVVVIPIPSPSPVNRSFNISRTRRKTTKLFNKLLNDPDFVKSLTTGAAA